MNEANQYLVLEDRGNGTLAWRILQPMPNGTALDSVPALDTYLRQQVIMPAMGPVPVPVADAVEDND